MTTRTRPVLTRLFSPILLAAAGVAGLAGCANDPYSGGRDVSDGSSGAVAGPVIREIARFDRDQITGIAVSKSGKAFVCSPLWHDGHRTAVIEILPGGTYRPYPNITWNSWQEGQVVDPSQRFICVQALTIDAKDRLWALDPAAPRLKGPIPGGAKLVRMDPNFQQVEWIIRFGPDNAPDGAYLNDVRIDAARDVAYITDSGLGAIIVTDLKTNRSRRLLADHPSTKAEANVTISIGGGAPLKFTDGSPMVVHSDGLALDRAGEYLYWQALTGKTLYRIPTSVLRDASLSAEQVGAAVENLGQTVVTDGMEIDAAGNIYFTAIEQSAIVVRRPDGTMETLVKNDLFAWPDSLAWGPNNELYFTTSQIHLSPWFSAGGTMPSTPFRVFRTNAAQ